MKKTVMLPVEIEAEDAASMVEAIRDLKANSARSSWTSRYSWVTAPDEILPNACPDCFGFGGEIEGTKIP